MENWIIYIMQCSICLALLYLPFWIFLRKETFFLVNRYALLVITALSFILPLLKIPEITPQLAPAIIMPSFHLEEINSWMYEEQNNTERPIDWMGIIEWIYWSGVLTCFLFKMVDFIRLMQFIPKGCLWREKEDGIYIHCHIRKVVPFSWMNHIVISETDYQENGEAILLHEKAHIAHGHSWDVLWISIVEILQWFNPFVWMLSKDMQNIHEYEADLSVLRQGINAKNYQNLIIQKAVSSNSYTFANSFNHSSLNKRITMMIKKKSNPWARAKYLYVLPLSVIALSAFAHPKISNKVNEILAQVLNVETKKPIAGTNVQILPLSEMSAAQIKQKYLLLDEGKLSQEECEKLKNDILYKELYSPSCSWYCSGNVHSVKASSYKKADSNGTYEAKNAHDFNHEQVWAEGVKGQGIGEYLEYEFKGDCPRITTVKIMNGDVKNDKAWRESSRVKRLKVYYNETPYAILELEDSRTLQCFELGEKLGYFDKNKPNWTLKFEIMEVYPGDKYQNTVISELRFDGEDIH